MRESPFNQSGETPWPIGQSKWFQRRKGLWFHHPGWRRPDLFAHFSAINMDGFKT